MTLVLIALVGLYCGLAYRDWFGPRLPPSVMLARLQTSPKHTLRSFFELQGLIAQEQRKLRALRASLEEQRRRSLATKTNLKQISSSLERILCRCGEGTCPGHSRPCRYRPCKLPAPPPNPKRPW